MLSKKHHLILLQAFLLLEQYKTPKENTAKILSCRSNDSYLLPFFLHKKSRFIQSPSLNSWEHLDKTLKSFIHLHLQSTFFLLSILQLNLSLTSNRMESPTCTVYISKKILRTICSMRSPHFIELLLLNINLLLLNI